MTPSETQNDPEPNGELSNTGGGELSADARNAALNDQQSEQVVQTAPPEPASNIYLGADGGYHDDTEENRERFPAQSDVDAQQLDDVAAQVGGEPVPFTEDGQVDGEALAAGTMSATGDGASSPEGSEVLSGETPSEAPKAAGTTTAKTRKQ